MQMICARCRREPRRLVKGRPHSYCSACQRELMKEYRKSPAWQRRERAVNRAYREANR